MLKNPKSRLLAVKNLVKKKKKKKLFFYHKKKKKKSINQKIDLKEWENCIGVIDKYSKKKEMIESLTREEDSSTEASLYYYKGLCFENMENRDKAAFWYNKALETDCYCYEAFERLTVGHMLDSKSENVLVSLFSNKSSSCSSWLTQFYCSQLNVYKKPLPLPQEVLKLQVDHDSIRNHSFQLKNFAQIYFHHNRHQEVYDITSK